MSSLALTVVAFLATFRVPASSPYAQAVLSFSVSAFIYGLFFYYKHWRYCLVASAYLQAPYMEIWPYLPEMRWITISSMPMASISIITGISSANSFSLETGANNLPPPTRHCRFMLTSCLMGDFGLGNRTHGGEWR